MDIIIRHLLKRIEAAFNELDQDKFNDALIDLYDELRNEVPAKSTEKAEEEATPIAARFDKKQLKPKSNKRMTRNLAPLSEDDVLEILRLVRERKYTQKSIAQAFKVSVNTITDIVNGRKYQDITGLPTIPVKKIRKKGKANAR